MDAFDTLFSLRGRRALITGGSRGIGRMIAEGFLRAGVAQLVISARKAQACEAAAEALNQLGLGRCTALPADVSSLAGAQALAAQLGQRLDGLDILVNNAGAAWAAPYAEFPESGWDKVLDTNLKAPFFLTQALTPLLKVGAAGRGGALAKVVNIASIDGLAVNPLETYSYAASKAGLIHLTRRMATRLIEDGIAVSAIAPGAFASDMNRAARDEADAVAQRIPARRIGRPQDMAGAAIYLASAAGDYVVGATLVVDGGVSLSRG